MHFYQYLVQKVIAFKLLINVVASDQQHSKRVEV